MTDFTIIKIRLLGSQLFFTWSTDDWQEEPQANQGPRQTMGRRQINQKPAVGSIDKGPHPTIHAFTHFRLMFYSCWDEALCRARLACLKDTTRAAGCHCSHVVYMLASLEHALLLHQATYSRDSVCENKGRGNRFKLLGIPVHALCSRLKPVHLNRLRWVTASKAAAFSAGISVSFTWEFRTSLNSWKSESVPE